MRLLGISLRNVRIRLVSSALTMVAIVVATGLYAAILLMISQTEQRYSGSIGWYRTVIGPKDASQLELVLNTIFHVGNAPGTIRLKVYDDLHEGRLGRGRTRVRFAIPQARGDSFSRYNFPVIGTTDEVWSRFQRQVDGKDQRLSFADGEGWRFTHEELMQLAEELARHENAVRQGETPAQRAPVLKPEWRHAVLGSRVARAMGMKLGDTLVPMHGKHGDLGTHEHPEAACTVTGVLAPTNSPIDSTIFIPLAVHYLIEGHAESLFLPDPPPGKSPAEVPVAREDLALTAVVVGPIDHMAPMLLRRELGTRPDAQAAWPQEVIPKFLQQIGNIADALRVIAWLVLLVAAVSIAVAIYNTMNERRREIAIMRSLGARRLQIAGIILGEAALLSFLGSVLGVLACHLTAWLMRAAVEDLTGVFLDWTAFSYDEAILVGAVTLLGAIAGLLPAIKGSLTQVADNLTPNY